MREQHLAKHTLYFFLVALSHQIAYACHNAAHHGGEEHGEPPDDQRVVAVIGHHLERHESKDEYLVALLEKEILYLVYEHLLGLLHNLGILAAHPVSHCGGCCEPRIGLSNFPVQDGGMDEAIDQFDRHPQVEVGGVTDQAHLHQCFDEYGCLEIGRHHIVLLVGIEQYGAVVDEIADERGGEQREEGEIDDAQLEDGVLEHEGEEGTDDDACRQHKTANITVKATEDRDYPADFFPVALGNGLIECIAHRGSHAQFG